MSKNVFANDMEIAYQAGDAKVIAAFPDVCLSPPPPPTGPVPVPYPNSSFARDLEKGSSSVKIGGKPIALETQSYYATSPLGDEAATRNFGGSVLTHTITGKTYFQAYSMDVTIEGKAVCRHLDITTSNHASYPGSTPPFPNQDKQRAAEAAIKENKCACCGGDAHGQGADMHRDEWYKDNIEVAHQHKLQGIDKGKAAAAAKLKQAKTAGDPAAIASAEALLADQSARVEAQKAYRDELLKKYEKLSRDAVAPKACGCPPVAPSPPCDVFYKRPPKGSKARDAQQKPIESKWSTFRAQQQAKPAHERIPPLVNMAEGDQVNHLTPKGAGGCPRGENNLTLDKDLCSDCKGLEDQFTEFQKLG